MNIFAYTRMSKTRKKVPLVSICEHLKAIGHVKARPAGYFAKADVSAYHVILDMVDLHRTKHTKDYTISIHDGRTGATLYAVRID